MNEEFDIAQNPGFSLTREVYDWIESAVTALIFVVLIFVFLGMVISVNGLSMSPTLEDGDRLVCSRMFREPRYMDIVVITKPGNKNNPLIKRVVAAGGQTIDFDEENCQVLIDGIPLREPYIAEQMDMYFAEYSGIYPLTVPEGHVFVMGDNRNNSWDSRVEEVGVIDNRFIFGRVVYRLMPYNRMGRPA